MPIQNKTRVLILQHPRERFHPLGTARIVHRCLKNSEIVVTHRGHLDAVNQAKRFPAGSALLYPGRGARDLRQLAADQVKTLVVLDGTWHHARTLYRDVSELHRLPCFSFLPERPTEYRVRREPKAEYVSTVEAVTHVLKSLEPETPGLGAMMSCFRKLVDLHIDATSNVGRSPRHRQRPKPTAPSKHPVQR
jgi:hypothetical protein